MTLLFLFLIKSFAFKNIETRNYFAKSNNLYTKMYYSHLQGDNSGKYQLSGIWKIDSLFKSDSVFYLPKQISIST